jgi:hypothetical protein
LALHFLEKPTRTPAAAAVFFRKKLLFPAEKLFIHWRLEYFIN